MNLHTPDRDRLKRLAETLVEAARRAGADQADALAVDGRAVSIDMRAGALEQAERAEGLEIGLRVLIGGRQATVSSSDHSEAVMAEMAERAVAMAREAPVDDYLGLADPGQLAQIRDADALELAEDAPEPDPVRLQDLAQRAEAAALQMQGISQVESASASYSHRRMWLAASNGFSGGYARTG
ncbi:MAG: PmbA/TldA family metallopeptidase, partial [Paracoccus sp. (in: a-proteobacteria)]